MLHASNTVLHGGLAIQRSTALMRIISFYSSFVFHFIATAAFLRSQ
jgi:hypothetical protein